MLNPCFILFVFSFCEAEVSGSEKRGGSIFFLERVNQTQLTRLRRELHLCIQSCHFAWWCVHNVLHVFVANMRLRRAGGGGRGGAVQAKAQCVAFRIRSTGLNSCDSCVFSFRQTHWKSITVMRSFYGGKFANNYPSYLHKELISWGQYWAQ